MTKPEYSGVLGNSEEERLVKDAVKKERLLAGTITNTAVSIVTSTMSPPLLIKCLNSIVDDLLWS